MAMATTVTGTVINIDEPTADWYLSNTTAQRGMPGFTKLRVKSITFIPSAANDVLVIKNSVDATAAAATIIDWTVVDVTDQRIMYFGERGADLMPFIDFSDCNFGTAANVSIIIHLA